MNPDEILAAAARAMANGVDPAKVDEAVRRRTGMSLQELGGHVGREQFPEAQPPQPSRGQQRQERFMRATGVTPPSADESQRAKDESLLFGRGASLGLTGLIPGEREAVGEARGRLGAGGSLLAEGAGGLATPGLGAARFIGKGATAGARVIRGLLAGGAGGAVYGGATAEPGERLAGAAKGAAIGAPLGGAVTAAGPVARGVTRGVARNQGLIGRVVRGVAEEFRTPLGRAKAWVTDRARQSGTQLSEAELNRLAESRLAQLEGNLTAPLRPKPKPKAHGRAAPEPRRPESYDELVAAQQRIERQLNPQGAEAEELARAMSAQADAALQRPPQAVTRTPRELGLEPVASAAPGRPADIRGISPNPQQHATRAQMEFRSAPIRERVTGLEEIQAVGLKAFQEGDQAMLDQVNQVLRDRGMAFDWSTIAEDAAKQARRQ